MTRQYAAVLSATRTSPAAQIGRASVVESLDGDTIEVSAQLLRMAQAKFPASEGWEKHQATHTDLPGQFCEHGVELILSLQQH